VLLHFSPDAFNFCPFGLSGATLGSLLSGGGLRWREAFLRGARFGFPRFPLPWPASPHGHGSFGGDRRRAQWQPGQCRMFIEGVGKVLPDTRAGNG